jgi:hypothetical protein
MDTKGLQSKFVRLKHLRPGFALIIAAKLLTISDLTGFTLDALVYIHTHIKTP